MLPCVQALTNFVPVRLKTLLLPPVTQHCGIYNSNIYDQNVAFQTANQLQNH